MKLVIRDWRKEKARPEQERHFRFEKVVRDLDPELRNFVKRKIRPEAVDDVLQEVWMAAWQNFESYDGRSKLRTWIYGICLHKCHDHYRSLKYADLHETLDDQPVLDPRTSPETLAIQADTLARLLSQLNDAQREVLDLYYYAQLTFSEISTLLNRNVNTVKYQFYKAHETLLACTDGKELK